MKTVCLKNFDYSSRTHKGLVREVNEDFLAYFNTINGHVFVLCDGMGGHNAGDVAAELAVEAIGRYFNDDYYKNPFESVDEAINYANKVVVRHSKGNNYLQGMGTTIVLVLIRDDRVFYGHAGDSRLYVLRNNNLEQLTTDHSHIQILLDKGLISKQDALNHPRRNEVTRAVGLSEQFEPDVSPKAYIPENEDILLLCSDGLTNMLSDEEIVAVLDSKYKINDKAGKLIRKANKKGGTDNISLHIVKIHNLLNAYEEDDENIHEKEKKLKVQKVIFAVIALLVLAISFFVGNNRKMKIEPIAKIHTQTNDNSKIIAYIPDNKENWSSIADKFNISTEKLNSLNPNIDRLDKTVHLKIPIKSMVVITQQNEIFILAEKYQLDIIDIMKANDLSSKYLDIGSEIIIPLSNKNK